MIDDLAAGIRASLESDGWVITPPVVDAQTLAEMTRRLQPPLDRSSTRGGVRNLLEASDVVREVAAVGPVRDAATAALGPGTGAVRAILFDKTPDANWKVVWHQDLTVAVAHERPTPGYGPWSVKDGVPHVQPPIAILEHMVAVRLHLDPCLADNGPVRVISGSHRAGRQSPDEIDRWRAGVPETVCLVERGGLLLFRPLLLHASSPATRPDHRRVLHIEYGPPNLSDELAWHCWVPARESRA